MKQMAFLTLILLRKKATKHGASRNMCYPITEAYLMFKNENPKVQVSYSKFGMP